MVITRLSSSIGVAAVAATLAFAASASATTFCVNNQKCVNNGGVNVGTDAAALNTALVNAQAAPGTDRVVVGSGTYARDHGFGYGAAENDNPVVLQGAGSGQTVLKDTFTLANSTALRVTAVGSSVTGVGIVMAGGKNAKGLDLTETGSVAKDIAVTTQPNTFTGTGASVGTGATLRNASVVGTSDQLASGVVGKGKLLDATVTGAATGIDGPVTVQRVTVSGAATGIVAAGAQNYKIDQALVKVPAGGTGITAASTVAASVVATVDHVTIVGAADSASIGAEAQAGAAGSPHNAKLVMRSSIIRRIGHGFRRLAFNGAANIEVDHTDVNLGTTLTSVGPGGSGALSDLGANLNVDPLFVSGNDRHLQAGSPVIDKGRATVQPNESPTDLDGLSRLFGPATDMGAYERH
jgi:hypothetical protein